MLDKISYKALKFIYRKQNRTFDELAKITGEDESKKTSKYISSLLKHGFISFWDQGELVDFNGFKSRKTIGYQIALPGAAYVEQRRRDLRNFWVPYAITTFIALLSLLGIVAEHWETIQDWLCHILE